MSIENDRRDTCFGALELPAGMVSRAQNALENVLAWLARRPNQGAPVGLILGVEYNAAQLADELRSNPDLALTVLASEIGGGHPAVQWYGHPAKIPSEKVAARIREFVHGSCSNDPFSRPVLFRGPEGYTRFDLAREARLGTDLGQELLYGHKLGRTAIGQHDIPPHLSAPKAFRMGVAAEIEAHCAADDTFVTATGTFSLPQLLHEIRDGGDAGNEFYNAVFPHIEASICGQAQKSA